MSFNYTPPVNGVFLSAKDEVRFLSNDTVESAESISDEDILYLLTQSEGDVYFAAADALERRAETFSNRSKLTKSVGDLSISKDYSAVAAELSALALRRRRGYGEAYVAKTRPPTGTDRGPVFTIGMMDY